MREQPIRHIDGSARKSHVAVNLVTRGHKALKIERLLGLGSHVGQIHLLEIGTGSGGIAHYFAVHPTLQCVVSAVDVRDNRLAHAGYDYQTVKGVQLPYDDARFDVVISNHVIEHVGDAAAQAAHLQEIRRVLRPGGVAYLAVPNRWMLTEPHYQIRFLSWLPPRWRSPYLRMRGKGDFYDCEPLALGTLERMLATADWQFRNLCIEGLRETMRIEQPDRWTTNLLEVIPDWFLRLLKPIIPTLIFRLERPTP